MRRQETVQETPREHRGNGSAFGFLLAGLSIGAAMSVLMAPRSGEETRKRVANKCLDGVEAAQAKVHQARLRMHEVMDEGERRVTAAVAAGRHAFAESDSNEKVI